MNFIFIRGVTWCLRILQFHAWCRCKWFRKFIWFDHFFFDTLIDEGRRIWIFYLSIEIPENTNWVTRHLATTFEFYILTLPRSFKKKLYELKKETSCRQANTKSRIKESSNFQNCLVLLCRNLSILYFYLFSLTITFCNVLFVRHYRNIYQSRYTRLNT